MFDERFRGDAFAGGVVIGDEAVAQHRQRGAADVLDRGGRVAVEQREGLRGAGEILRGARPRAPLDVAFVQHLGFLDPLTMATAFVPGFSSSNHALPASFGPSPMPRPKASMS